MYFKLALLLLLWFGWKNLSIFLLVINLMVNKFGKKFFAGFCSTFADDYNKVANPFKLELFKELNDMKPGEKISVLEIGAGPGSNFKYYNRAMTVQAVEPNQCFRAAFESNRAKYPMLDIKEMKAGYGEDLPIKDNSIDVVVITLALCSVNDQEKCLSEIKRVLKPGGKFFYMEHIVDDVNTQLRLIQQILTTVGFWQWGFAGCCLDR